MKSSRVNCQWSIDPDRDGRARRRAGRAGEEVRARAVVLLEVVLALSLFVATAATVGAALSNCSDAAVRLRIRTHAADLAVTLLSEIQLGLIEPVSTDPTTYDDEALSDWTWDIETEDVEDSDTLFRMRVTVTHEPTGLGHSLACLMAGAAAEELQL